MNKRDSESNYDVAGTGQRVRMLSTTETWASTPMGSWEIPDSEVATFAHDYRVTRSAAAGLLFVSDQASGLVSTAGLKSESPSLHESTSGAEALASCAPPLVFPAAHASDMLADGGNIETPHCTRASSGSPFGLEYTPGAGVGVQSDEPVSVAARDDVRDISTKHADESPSEASTGMESSRAGVFAVAEHPVAVPVFRLESCSDETGAQTDITPSLRIGASGKAPDAANVEDLIAVLPAPTESVASTGAAIGCSSLEDALALIEAGKARQALVYLDAVRNAPGASLGAWVLTSRAWTQIAQETHSPAAYQHAVEALHYVAENDGTSVDSWLRIGQLRLRQATSGRGQESDEAFDAAIVALRHAVEQSGHSDVDALTMLGDALAERADRTSADLERDLKALRFAEAVSTFREAKSLVRDPSSLAAWNLQEALQAQARASSTLESARLRMEVDALLAEGLKNVTDDYRSLWYLAKVRNELAHAELAGGATRALHLRTFRSTYHHVLTGADATPDMLLSWLELISLEIGHLRGEAAHSRFAEGYAILDRLDSLLPGNVHVAMARVRLLRRRAAPRSEGPRATVLTEALQCVMPFVDRAGDTAQARMEAAELMLERAACITGSEAVDDFTRAESVAEPLMDHSDFGITAMRCVIESRLARSLPVDSTLGQRLLEAGAADARSRWTLARLALSNGDARAACAHCEAAAKLQDAKPGASQLSLWEQASRQWSASEGALHDSAWQANRQRLRAAG